MEIFKLTLEACNPDRNCFRFWELRVGPDLLEKWVVTTQWGRIGTTGQIKTLVMAGEEEARKEVYSHLRRRVSSPKRIGIGYKLTFLFDPEDWLREENILENF